MGWPLLTSDKIDQETLRRNIQAKMQKLLELQAQAEYYQQVLENATLVLTEIIRTSKILEEITKSEKRSIEGLINLGAGVYSTGSIDFSEKVLVNVGSSVGVWMPLEKALERIKKQEENLKDLANKTRANLNNVLETISKLQMEIEKMRSYLEEKK